MPLVELGSRWLHVSGKTAVVALREHDLIGVVYDKVDDPTGPNSQYGVQRIGFGEFLSAHSFIEADARGMLLTG